MPARIHSYSEFNPITFIGAGGFPIQLFLLTKYFESLTINALDVYFLLRLIIGWTH